MQQRSKLQISAPSLLASDGKHLTVPVFVVHWRRRRPNSLRNATRTTERRILRFRLKMGSEGPAKALGVPIPASPINLVVSQGGTATKGKRTLNNKGIASTAEFRPKATGHREYPTKWTSPYCEVSGFQINGLLQALSFIVTPSFLQVFNYNRLGVRANRIT